MVTVTAPKMAAAKKLTNRILSNRLAACVNILPGVHSHYWWEGKKVRGREVLLLIKTRKNLFGKLSRLVLKHHPYEVPEILAFPIAAGHKPYLNWLRHETK